MWRLVRVLLVLALVALVALVAYAYLGPLLAPDEFAPPQHEVVTPVDLGLG